tara:strand:- start:61 stop:330 length:270 start_codon:yes stop_codon:yes gene_type:complete
MLELVDGVGTQDGNCGKSLGLCNGESIGSAKGIKTKERYTMNSALLKLEKKHKRKQQFINLLCLSILFCGASVLSCIILVNLRIILSIT